MHRIAFAKFTAFVALALVCSLSASLTQAQTTAFTYQGRLTDSNLPANGVYDFQFKLFDAVNAGTQIGSTLAPTNVTVSSGIFTVSLDFGAAAFPGANRWLEISVRVAGGGAFTTLTPRQPLTSTPYAIKSLNAAAADSLSTACVNSVSSAQIGSLPTGSGNYIQNTNSQQASSNFNISGNGTAGGTLSGNIISATTQFNLGGNRILSATGTNNMFAGVSAGFSNTTGGNNSFFGRSVGAANTTANSNSFFGSAAGQSNTMGNNNTFFGASAGYDNTMGSFNTFVGVGAGTDNQTGNLNTFVGENAGTHNTTGSNHLFVGGNAGSSNTTGTANTLIGRFTDVGSGNLINATAIGAYAKVDASNSLVLGSINGVNGATASTNVGIGTTAPSQKLFVDGGSAAVTRLGINSDTGNTGVGLYLSNAPKWSVAATGANGDFQIFEDDAGFNRFYISGSGANQGFVGIGTTAPTELLSVNGNASKAQGGASWAVFSDERLKNIKGRFTPGLDTLMRLQPIRYSYKPDNALGLKGDNEAVGFSAQAVARVLPEAVNLTASGYLQLNHDPILWTMLNAIKEQQQQIEQLKQQQAEITQLKQLLCAEKPQAAVCQTRNR